MTTVASIEIFLEIYVEMSQIVSVRYIYDERIGVLFISSPSFNGSLLIGYVELKLFAFIPWELKLFLVHLVLISIFRKL